MNERDKYLTELLGECWHESQDIASWRCNKCGFVRSIDDWVDQDCNNKFSTWSGFGKLWNWAKEQEWWGVGLLGMETQGKYIHIPIYFINPDRFSDAIYKYLKEREK